MSGTLKAKSERYKNLVQKKSLSDDEISEIAKLEYMNREDMDG